MVRGGGGGAVFADETGDDAGGAEADFGGEPAEEVVGGVGRQIPDVVGEVLADGAVGVEDGGVFGGAVGAGRGEEAGAGETAGGGVETTGGRHGGGGG